MKEIRQRPREGEAIFYELKMLGVLQHGVICGGFARHLIDGRGYTDIDVFCNKQYGADAIADILLAVGYKQISPNRYKDKEIVEIVHHDKEDLGSLLNTFDLYTAMVAYDGDRLWVAGERVINSINCGVIDVNYDQFVYPASTLGRVMRYIGRGYTIVKNDVQRITEEIIKCKNSQLWRHPES